MAEAALEPMVQAALEPIVEVPLGQIVEVAPEPVVELRDGAHVLNDHAAEVGEKNVRKQGIYDLQPLLSNRRKKPKR